MPETALIVAASATFGAVVGAASTFLIARKNLKKEISLKMAEYRLQWINNLGDEFAEFASNAATAFVFSKKGIEKEQYKAVIRSFTKVEMLMNAEDKEYNNLVDAMNNLTDYAGSHQNSELDEDKIAKFYELRNNFSIIANNILKREWKKTKRHLREDTVEVSALSSELPPNTESFYLYGKKHSQEEAD